MTINTTPTEQDKELLSKLDRLIIENQSDDGSIDISDQRAMRDEIMQLITADRKRVELEVRIDTATDILYGFSRTYKQKVTDSDGNVYIDESHDYISKYEVHELVSKLKAQQEEV